MEKNSNCTVESLDSTVQGAVKRLAEYPENKQLVFGAGAWGRRYQGYVEQSGLGEIIGFLDNSDQMTAIEGKNGSRIPVYQPKEVKDLEYDIIVISNKSPKQVLEIRNQLDLLGIRPEKVAVLRENSDVMIKMLSSGNLYNEDTDSRVCWLRNFAAYANQRNLSGCVAEAGVCYGDFAYYINKYFPEKDIYLFDTFEGFDNRDLETERSLGDPSFLSGMFNQRHMFSETNERIVLDRMLHSDKCVLRKGYFPDSAAGIEEEFCFVNLDMDLYQPMLGALQFFYDKMCQGGVILTHDYFHPELPGVKAAIEEFERERETMLCKVPIGDFCSIAVIKP